MQTRPFEEIWQRIVAHVGEKFHTRNDLEFTYKIDGTEFYPSRTSYRIQKSDFEKAYGMAPIKGPGAINKIVRGPSYVWAVLDDKRISEGEW